MLKQLYYGSSQTEKNKIAERQQKNAYLFKAASFEHLSEMRQTCFTSQRLFELRILQGTGGFECVRETNQERTEKKEKRNSGKRERGEKNETLKHGRAF